MKQSTQMLMMIRPASFRMNEQTAVNNAYQQEGSGAGDPVTKAQDEFDGVVNVLRNHGVQVAVYDDDETADTPDALFPNNWVSFHSDGRVGLYPMFAVNRRRERRESLLHALAEDFSVEVSEFVDFTEFEEHGVFLEGTGSLILDRPNKIAYAAIGPRTDLRAAEQWAEVFQYTLVPFTAMQTSGDQNSPIYHTNVMLAIGTDWAVVCPDIITDDQERQQVLSSLRNTGHHTVEIRPEQVNGFAGNVLEVSSGEDTPIIAMSSAAHASFSPEQRDALSAFAPLVHAPIPTIERLGGGSVRCMLAEVFLPPIAP